MTTSDDPVVLALAAAIAREAVAQILAEQQKESAIETARRMRRRSKLA